MICIIIKNKLSQAEVIDNKSNQFSKISTYYEKDNDKIIKYDNTIFGFLIDNKDKIINCFDKNISVNKLPHSLFDLDYVYRDGVTTLILVEYY